MIEICSASTSLGNKMMKSSAREEVTKLTALAQTATAQDQNLDA